MIYLDCFDTYDPTIMNTTYTRSPLPVRTIDVNGTTMNAPYKVSVQAMLDNADNANNVILPLYVNHNYYPMKNEEISAWICYFANACNADSLIVPYYYSANRQLFDHIPMRWVYDVDLIRAYYPNRDFIIGRLDYVTVRLAHKYGPNRIMILPYGFNYLKERVRHYYPSLNDTELVAKVYKLLNERDEHRIVMHWLRRIGYYNYTTNAIPSPLLYGFMQLLSKRITCNIFEPTNNRFVVVLGHAAHGLCPRSDGEDVQKYADQISKLTEAMADIDRALRDIRNMPKIMHSRDSSVIALNMLKDIEYQLSLI